MSRNRLRSISWGILEDIRRAIHQAGRNSAACSAGRCNSARVLVQADTAVTAERLWPRVTGLPRKVVRQFRLAEYRCRATPLSSEY